MMYMRYIISITSQLNGRPCDESDRFLGKLTRLDWRRCKTLDAIRNHQSIKGWFDSGTNHREENGMVVRELEVVFEEGEYYKLYTMKVPDITKFVDTYGCVVIKPSDYKEIRYEIEIYDSYRE